MSTLAYAAMTRQRRAARPHTSTDKAPPGVRTYVDAFAALVPAEILAAHGAILSIATKKTMQGGIEIKDSTSSAWWWIFAALLIASVVLYVAGRLPSAAGGQLRWDKWDWARMWISPLAFVGWMMLQKATVFDAIAPNFNEIPRFTIAIIGGGVLGVIASQLAYRADQGPAHGK